MKTFIDPGFAIHRAVGELNARLMLKLADAPVIPFGILDYSSALMKGASDVKRILQQGNVKNVSTGRFSLFSCLLLFHCIRIDGNNSFFALNPF